MYPENQFLFARWNLVQAMTAQKGFHIDKVIEQK